MSRIRRVFAQSKPPALIAYVTVGYPSLEATLEVVPLLERLGVDIVELGIPFSDPLVDGVTIQSASSRALQEGVTATSCLEVARQLRRNLEIPLVLMSYYNPIFSYGLQDFTQAAAEAGVDGLIIPDLPPGEDEELRMAKRGLQLDLIQLVGPTSTPARVEQVAASSEGFVYLVSVAGVTGARAVLPYGLKDLIQRVKACSDQPVCVGFGISTAEQAQEVGQLADGVVVGSRIVELMGESARWEDPVSTFVSTLREGLDKLGELTP